MFVSVRRWVAWKLVQLADRIHNADSYERIYIVDASGELICEVIICSDPYGRGVSSVSTPGAGMYDADAVEAMALGDLVVRDLPPGCSVYWDDDYKPDWLEG